MTTQQQLELKLEEIRNNNQFITGVISFSDTEENMKTILDYIENNPNCDYQDISLLAFEMNENRR